MLFNYRYHGNTSVESSASATAMDFSPDTFREPTYFIGELDQRIPFREAVSALHDVVVSDLRYKPKDRDQYFRWLEANEQNMLAEFMAQEKELSEKIALINQDLNALYRQRDQVMQPYYTARKKYYDYLYKQDYDAWFVLDPVITVNPDELFFECFSQDESSYGRLSCNYDVFKNVNEFACGTTNIDYSADLYLEFQKIRSYKKTEFKLDPGGFELATGTDDGYIENKIDLPESWVRGFLQVSSAMTMPMRTIKLHPMDMHNICFLLRRKKEKSGPRSLRFILKPGERVKILFEPWNIELVCKRSEYLGDTEDEIRLWGRRRLQILERLIPIADYFEVHLLGSGMPSFFVAHMASMAFTLGLSGWTANDWSRLGNFDLMAPRAEVDDFTKKRVFKALKENWVESADSLSTRLNLDRDQVLAALQIYTQAGRVIYDIKNQVYRVRELSLDPLPMNTLRFANEREEKANVFYKASLVKLINKDSRSDSVTLSGEVTEDGKKYTTDIVIDNDQRLVKGTCQCHFYITNKLYKGPCEHMLALRIKYNQDRK